VTADWGRVFALLLSVRQEAPSLAAVRAVLEPFLEQKGRALKHLLPRLKITLHEASGH
jgi:hypothetical protein